jgi:hypothetical protein
MRGDFGMNRMDRRQHERRQAALNEWRALGRRADDRKRLENARIADWLRKFDEFRMARGG